MATFLSILKTILQILGAIPTALQAFYAIQKAVNAQEKKRRDAGELKRKENLKSTGDKLKKSIEAENEKATEDALSGILDDYNK